MSPDLCLESLSQPHQEPGQAHTHTVDFGTMILYFPLSLSLSESFFFSSFIHSSLMVVQFSRCSLILPNVGNIVFEIVPIGTALASVGVDESDVLFTFDFR